MTNNYALYVTVLILIISIKELCNAHNIDGHNNILKINLSTTLIFNIQLNKYLQLLNDSEQMHRFEKHYTQQKTKLKN